MQTKQKMLSRAGLLALVALGWMPLSAQVNPATAAAPANEEKKKDEAVVLQTFVVTGVRASLASAQEIKRGKIEIVDSIVASDINKLPDYNVTDALQRITGIQILRDRGEGAGITIRGLSQMEHTLNGREIFTAGLASTGGPSRQIDFADVPSEMIAGINVYKTSSAEHIEGGIGGMVEMITRRPFDFEGFEAVGSARLINGDLAKSTKPQYSGLVSNRWKLAGGAEFGALVNLTYQERQWREDQKGTGTPTARTDIIPGQTVTVQNSDTENTVFGKRERIGLTAVLQYRPTSKLEFYAEANYTKFDTLQDTNQINVSAGAFTFVPGSVVLSPGTSNLQSITWTNPTITVLSFARDTHDWTKQFAAGAIWKGDDLRVKFDASYTDSYNDLYFVGPFFATTGTTFTQDVSTEVPSTAVGGVNLTDPASFRYTGNAYRVRPYNGDLQTLAADGTYNLHTGVFHTILGGVRYAKRNATNKPGLIFADYNYAAGTGPLGNAFPALVTTNTYGFFPYTGTPSIRNYVTGVLDAAREATSYRALFGITTPLPTSANPLSLWDINETTLAAYLAGKFKVDRFPLEGNVGLRFVQTKEALTGTRTIPATGTTAATTAPLNLDTKYNNVLPSLNTRYTLADELFLKFSASKTVTRPDFNQLSPSLTLVPNPITPSLNQGSAGNPDLRPIKSTNYDLAIEKYFNPTTSVYATVFYKKVDGFIVSSAATETYDGLSYLITRPRNANPATIKGYEIGYTQFFDFLPEAFKGLGVQANFTYIDSQTPNATLASNTPLPNLSKNSYNVIGMYETKKLSVRVAYNWRDKFLSGQANIANVGRIPFYTKAYGWMDASVNYKFTDKLSLSLEGTNLLRTKRLSYYGVETLPQNVYINDRQIAASMSYRF